MKGYVLISTFYNSAAYIMISVDKHNKYFYVYNMIVTKYVKWNFGTFCKFKHKKKIHNLHKHCIS